MNQYQDEHGLWHDRDIKRYGKSNNWQNYTAMALYLGLPVDGKLYRQYFRQCVSNLNGRNIKILRHPKKTQPPYSADCCIGDYVMGQIPYAELKRNHFVFHGSGKPLSPNLIADILVGVTKLAALATIFRRFDRNHFWKYKVEEIFQAAYRLHPGYVFCVKKHAGATIHKEEKQLFKLYVKCTLNKKKKSHGDISQKNLLWLLAMHMGDQKLARKCKPWENIPAYFGDSHPFSIRVKELREKGLL